MVSKIWNSPSARNVGKLLSANVIAQVLGILVYPILTRLYTSEDFGLLNLFLSIGGVLTLFSTLNYHYAIVLPKEDRKSTVLVQLSMIILITWVALLMCMIPFSSCFAGFFQVPELANWLWLMPLYVAGIGIWTILNNFYTRYKYFGRISMYQLSQSLLNAAGKIGFGKIIFLSGGMIVATVGSTIIAIVISLCRIGKHLFAGLWDFNKSEIISIVKEYSKFPKYSFPQSLVNTFSSNISILLLTPVFGTSHVGYFGMALTIAFRPLQMLVQSFYQVLFQRVASLVNENQSITKLIYRYLGTIAAVFIPIFVLLYIWLPQLTGLLLGEGWQITGEYIRLMLPWLLMMTMTGSLTFITDIFGLQHPAFWVEVIYTGLRCGALLIGIAMNDIRCAILLFSLVSAVVILGQLIWFITIVRKYEKTIKKN